MFSVDDIMCVPVVQDTFEDVKRRYPDISEDRLIHEAVRDLIGIMVRDLLEETRRRLSKHKPKSAEDVRALSEPIAAFSDEFKEKEKPLRVFLFENMYRHYKVNRMMGQARRVVTELFELFIADPDILPTEYGLQCDTAHSSKTARVVCDYIAAMTDAQAINEHKKLFSVTGYLS